MAGYILQGKNQSGEMVDIPLAATYDAAGNKIEEYYATKTEAKRPGFFYCNAESSDGGVELLYVSVDTITPIGVAVDDLILWQGRVYEAYDVSSMVYANYKYDLNGTEGADGSRWWVTQVEIPDGATYIAKTGITGANINDWVISTNAASNAACAQIFNDIGTKWAVRRYGFLCADRTAGQAGNGIYYSTEEATSDSYTFDKANLQPTPSSDSDGLLIVSASGYLYQCTSVIADGAGYDCSKLFNIKGADGADGAPGADGSSVSSVAVDIDGDNQIQVSVTSNDGSIVSSTRTPLPSGGGNISYQLIIPGETAEFGVAALAATRSIKVLSMDYGTVQVYDDSQTLDLAVTNADIVMVENTPQINVGVSGWASEDGTMFTPAVGYTVISMDDTTLLHISPNSSAPVLLMITA